jgi:hypothetical protein
MALRVVDYVKQTSHPEWEIGRVISINESKRSPFFSCAEENELFKPALPPLEHADGRYPILEIAGSANWN